MFLLLALLVVVALLYFGVTAVAAALGSRGAAVPVAVLVGGAVTVVVVLVGLTLGLGLVRDAPGADEGAGPSPTPDPRPERPARPVPPARPRPALPEPAPRLGTAAVLGPVVRADAGDGNEAAAQEAVGELVPGTVLRVEASGFPSFATTRVRQCAATSCGNEVTVHVSEGGTASFLFLVTDTLGPSRAAGSCRLTTAPCSVVIENVDGEGRAEVPMLFHDAVPPPGRLRVSPVRGLEDGSAVTIRLEGFPAGAEARVVLCGGQPADAPRSCGRPGLDLPVSIAEDGTATVRSTIHAGPVGTDRVPCGRGTSCSLAVISDDAFVRAPAVILAFRAPPGASYDEGRLMGGLAVAALMLLAGVLLVRRTDWSSLGEEAAPEIDEAEYADLDAIVAALPPEPDLDEMIAALG